MGAFVDHDVSYRPEHLRLSDAMKARIKKGECDEQKVRQATSELIERFTTLPHDPEDILDPHNSKLHYLEPHQELIDYYQENRALVDVMATDSDGNSLLRYAIYWGPIPIIQGLIDDGASIDPVDKDGNNALMHSMGHRPKLKPLHQLALDLGCNPYQPNRIRQHNAVSSAIIGEHLDLLKWLLSRGVNAYRPCIECSPSSAFYPSWIDLSNKGYTTKEALELLSEHYDTMMVDMQHTDSGEKFKEIAAKNRKCHDMLEHLSRYEAKWKMFVTSPNVETLQTQDLIGFSNINKLDEALENALWRGHEQKLASHLSQLAPYLTEEILQHHAWIVEHLASQDQPKPTPWTQRIEATSTSDRGRS